MFHTLLAALFCLMVPALTCADEIVGARVEYWSMGLSGDSSVSSGDFTLPTLSLTDSTDGLGLDSDNPVGGSAWLNLGPFFLFGRYTPIDIAGQGSTTSEITLGGETLTGTIDLDSSLTFNMFDAGLGLNLLNLDDLPIRVQVGLLVEVKLLDGTLEVTGTGTPKGSSATGTTTDTQDFTLPIPMAGGHVKLGLADFLAIDLRGAAIGYSGNHLYDAEARVELSPIPFAGISGGYRIMDLAIDESDVNLNATFDGPFVEAFIRF